MLVLSRMRGEEILIGNDITIVVVEVRNGKVRLGIEAPKDVPVHRREVYDAICRQYIGDASREVMGAIAEAVCSDVPNRVIEDALDAAENERRQHA
jgi:carbon storage regulator